MHIPNPTIRVETPQERNQQLFELHSDQVAGAGEEMAAAAVAARRDAEAELNLPPGFRFHPTDEELVLHYLCKKVARQMLPVPIIAEVDLYKFDPWQLPDKALFGQKEWYFFTPRDRKYPNGSRPNRAAGRGYWKATGADKPVSPKGSNRTLGIKKALVFYSGKAPKGVKTDWIMHEYRLTDANIKKGNQRLDEWVLCRLYNKKNSWEKEREKAKAELEKDVVHHRQHGEVMDPTADTLSDSFQTHDSEIDNISVFRGFADMAQFGAIPSQAQQSAGGMQGMRAAAAGNAVVKEDNDWFMDLNLDDLQASFMSPGPAANPASGQDYYSAALSSPQMRMYLMQPF